MKNKTWQAMQQLNKLLKGCRASTDTINRYDKVREILQEQPCFKYKGTPQSQGRHLLVMNSEKHDATFTITAFTPPRSRYRGPDTPLDIAYVTATQNQGNK